MNKIELCVLFGGKSSEYEVSLRSSCAVLNAIDKEKYIIHKIGIAKDGKWYLFEGENSEILNDIWHKNEKNKAICVDFSQKCFMAGDTLICPDVIFPVMHGEYGEDGRIQALCELMGIKCVGVGSASASLCMDKYLCKSIAMRELIPVVPYIAVRKGYFEMGELLKEIGESISDIFVKPTLGGSSVGISRVHSEGELFKALDIAFCHSDTVLVEQAINGKECEVAVLEKNGEIIVSEVGEISYKASFYDYQTKYFSDKVKYAIPAKIDEKSRDMCRDFAKRLFLALGCRGMCRVDFFVSESNEVYFNEVNAIPGFTSASMYPMLMEHEGYDMSALIDELIFGAL